jgi:hypothetical protein
MTVLSEQEILELALANFGHPLQKVMAIEEMAELTKELVKNIRGRNNIEEIIDELVDVELMMKQLNLMYVNNEATRSIKKDRYDYKLNRLYSRIQAHNQGLLGDN